MTRLQFLCEHFVQYMIEQKKEEGKRKEGMKKHRRDGPPTEGYEGSGQGHISPCQHVRWWLTRDTTPGLS